MKKILLLIIPILFITGCVEVVEEDNNKNETTTPTKKPLTKQICDWTGWDSGSIISEQAEQGYIFTGRSKGFWCENMLNFQLEDNN